MPAWMFLTAESRRGAVIFYTKLNGLHRILKKIHLVFNRDSRHPPFLLVRRRRLKIANALAVSKRTVFRYLTQGSPFLIPDPSEAIDIAATDFCGGLGACFH